MMNGRCILLVEDNPDDVLLLEHAFKKVGWSSALKIVRNGEQAIAYLGGTGVYTDRQEYPFPFLVLLDLRMPGTDGFDVLQWARAQPSLKRLLIVVLTSSNVQADVDRPYELGANSYLVKPVDFEEMVNMLKRFEVYWSEINRTPTTPVLVQPAVPESSLS